MSDSDIHELEQDFWATMRVRWFPRVAVGGILFVASLITFSCVDDSGWRRAVREERRVAYNDSLHRAERARDYRVMGVWCRAKLRLASTAKDSAKVLAMNATYGFANETGFICENWMLGEPKP